MLNLVYTSAPLTRCAVCVWRVFGAQLINFPQTWDKQKIPGTWKGHPGHPVLLVFAQKLTNFESRRMVCELFADGAVLSTHMRIWFANHSARLCIRAFRKPAICSITSHFPRVYICYGIREIGGLYLWKCPKNHGLRHKITSSGYTAFSNRFNWVINR